MDTTFENDDSTNVDDEVNEVSEETTDTSSLTEKREYTEAEKRAFARAKTAEAQYKELKAQLNTAPQKKSEDFDYGELAYLATKGVEDEKDLARIRQIQKFNGMSIREIVNNPDYQLELKRSKELRQTESAIPTEVRTGAPTAESVQYWMTKPFEEVPHNMRNKVIEARLDKEKNKGKFYNS